MGDSKYLYLQLLSVMVVKKNNNTFCKKHVYMCFFAVLQFCSIATLPLVVGVTP